MPAGWGEEERFAAARGARDDPASHGPTTGSLGELEIVAQLCSGPASGRIPRRARAGAGSTVASDAGVRTDRHAAERGEL